MAGITQDDTIVNRVFSTGSPGNYMMRMFFAEIKPLAA